MAEIRTRLVIRNDLKATWESVNPILYKGEIGIEIDTNKLKIGDGSKTWTELPYFVTSADAVVDELIGRVTAVEGKVTALEGQVTAINEKTAGYDSKIAEIEGSIEDFLSQLEAKADLTVVNGIGDRVTTLEGAIGTQPTDDTRTVFERLAANDNLASQIEGLNNGFSGLDSRVTAVENDLVVLKGTGEGSISKTVDDAINAWATSVTDDGTLNTFKEIIDYVADHKGEATQMMTDIEGLKAKDTTLEGQIASLTSGLAGKVDVKEGHSLVADTLITKLEGLDANAEANYIKSVDAEMFAVDANGNLTLQDLPQSKIVGLTEALANAGQLNGVQINGTDLDNTNKKVNIQFSEEFSYADNKISVNKVNASKLYVEDGEELILNGGNA